MQGRVFGAITKQDYSGLDFKVRDSKAIIDKLGISATEVVAIGDSPADRGIFEFAGHSIAIDPSPAVAKEVDYVIHYDLRDAIPILESLHINPKVP